jgi:hypothetical protein
VGVTAALRMGKSDVEPELEPEEDDDEEEGEEE